MKDRKSKDAIGGFKEIYGTNIKLIMLLKNEIRIHQNYLPQEIFNAYSKVVEQIQSDMKRWLEMAEYISAGNHEKINYDEAKKMTDKILFIIACAETKVKGRLIEMSGYDE